jgi:hypothetical protein
MPLWTTTISPVAIAVRVRVFFRGATVRRPARVPDAKEPFQRIQADGFFEIAQFAGAPDAPRDDCRHSKPRFRPNHTRGIPVSADHPG